MLTRPVRRITLITLIALTASSVLLTACGGPETPKAATDNAARPAPHSAPRPAHITAEQARGALLGTQDLPEGWKTAHKNKHRKKAELKGVQARCLPLAAVVNTGRLEGEYATHAHRVFTKQGEDGQATGLAQDVSGYPRQRAEQGMRRLRDAVEHCGSFTGTLADTQATLRVKRHDAPRYGDDVLAYSVSVTVDDVRMDFDLATVRSHGAVTTLVESHPAETEHNRQAVDRALSVAATRLTRAAAATA
ncbi:hypothetical protein [Streptomyces orinoci]|uniref:Lipoprotein n=1 Tax=Streptomyces orinoci TaxID=67339 RepID=A0ABV3K3M9_STRON|nr:hypothetical protein [Streptomyces orinoci]